MCQKPRPGPGQAKAKPSVAALARPRISTGQSRARTSLQAATVSRRSSPSSAPIQISFPSCLCVCGVIVSFYQTTAMVSTTLVPCRLYLSNFPRSNRRCCSSFPRTAPVSQMVPLRTTGSMIGQVIRLRILYYDLLALVFIS